jgi:hypothetical protein
MDRRDAMFGGMSLPRNRRIVIVVIRNSVNEYTRGLLVGIADMSFHAFVIMFMTIFLPLDTNSGESAVLIYHKRKRMNPRRLNDRGIKGNK